jgi:DNA-binding MarR family transcriptional regulator
VSQRLVWRWNAPLTMAGLTITVYYSIVYSITRLLEDVSLAQFRALAEFRYQIRKFQHSSEKAARDLGLEPQQHQLLLAIKGFDGESPGPTIGYLAERLQVRHHSAVELVDRMEMHGLVHRRSGEHDRRQVIVTLCDPGERILKDLATQHIAEIQQSGPGLVAALQQVLASESYARARGLEHP